MFDPTYPPANAEIESAPLRSQFNGLKALIDAITTVGAAQVDGVSTLNPGEPATVDLTVAGNTLHFTFGIPRGSDGSNGSDGTSVSGAVIDGVATLEPYQGATANVNFDTGSQILHFSFGIPRGQTGDAGPPGPQGPAFGNAVVDGVSTLDPGQPASAQAWFDGNVVHFTFSIPRGNDGVQGPPGEVTNQQLNDAIAGTSANTNTISTLDTTFADPDMEALRQKLNEMILNGRR